MKPYPIACTDNPPSDIEVYNNRCYLEFEIDTGTIWSVANVDFGEIPDLEMQLYEVSPIAGLRRYVVSFPVRPGITAADFEIILP
jgi:hypothetical protein